MDQKTPTQRSRISINIWRRQVSRIIALPAGLLAFAASATLPLPARGQAFGCCQYTTPRCVQGVAQSVCTASGGRFFGDVPCDATQSFCGVPLPPRHPPRPVHALRPHPPLVQPILATQSPTSTRTPALSGCCELKSRTGRICTDTDALTCSQLQGLFSENAACDPVVGGCVDTGTQAATPTPTATPTPRCGDGVIEPGEECETDADCHSPVEGCSECTCIGAVLITLRWTDQNDLNLRVIDPLGRVWVPPQDANGGCVDTTKAAEEDIFFAPGRAPLGCYTVEARYDQQCPEAGTVDTHLNLRLNVEGDKATVNAVPGLSPGGVFTTRFGVRAACGGPPPLP